MVERLYNDSSILFSLLKIAMGEECFPPSMSQVRWDGVFGIACNQGVAAIAFDGLQKLFDSHSSFTSIFDTQDNRRLKYDWFGQSLSIERTFDQQEKAAIDLSVLFHEEGIRILVMKGFSYASLYPVPNHRPSNDIDCYLCGQFEAGNQLVEKLGIKVSRNDYRHSSFVFKGLHVENHRICTTVRGRKQRKSFERYLRSLLENCQTEFYHNSFLELPCPLFNTLYFFQHAHRHFLREGITLRYICDWAMMVRSYGATLDWGEFFRVIKDNSLEPFVQSMSRLAYYVCGAKAAWLDDYTIQKQDTLLLEDCFKIGDNAIVYNGAFRSHIQMVKNMFSMRWKYRFFCDRPMLVELVSSCWGVLFERTPKV